MPIYMKIVGIDGDVTAKGYEKSFELGSMQWGVSRESPTASKPTFSYFDVMKNSTVGSTQLMLACAKASNLGSVVISIVVPGGTGAPVLVDKFTLENVGVMAFAQSGDGRPAEDMRLSFSKITYSHTAGSLTQTNFWNLSTNTGG